MILLCKFPENLGQLCIRVKVLPCLRGESHIDFRTQCVTMTVVGGGWGGDGGIANDVWEIRKVIKFERSCIVIYFSYIYPIIDGERSFISEESS